MEYGSKAESRSESGENAQRQVLFLFSHPELLWLPVREDPILTMNEAKTILAEKIKEYGFQKIVDVILSWERKKRLDRERLRAKKNANYSS